MELHNAPVPESPDQPKLALMVQGESYEDKVGAIGEKLVLLAAFAKELQTQSHLIHFNYEGSNFLAVHQFLKDQYELHTEQFDTLGELVRTLNYWMPMCSKGLKESLGPCFKHCDCYEGNAMLSTYYRNLESFSSMVKMVEPDAQETQHYDIANYLGELIGQIWKTCWMVKATLKN